MDVRDDGFDLGRAGTIDNGELCRSPLLKQAQQAARRRGIFVRAAGLFAQSPYELHNDGFRSR